MQVLVPEEWRELQAFHAERASTWVEPHLERRRHGEKHPVWDFLFDYYRLRPTHLTRWHPGVGVVLEAAADDPIAQFRDYSVSSTGAVTVDVESFVARRREGLEWIQRLLRRTQENPAQFDCFGLHEWAMVYRTDQPRHSLPLRLGAEATNAVVESHRIKCTHYDAYRFFTTPARPLNLTVLSRESQPVREQPGCVHTTMDLYKWATKLGPLVPGDLLLDCFELATQARRLDMEASPYDCRELGFGVVAIETASGKAEYVERQRALTENAAPLRGRLAQILDSALRGAGSLST